MRIVIKLCISSVIAVIGGMLMTYGLLLPTLAEYERIAKMMDRFGYSELVLCMVVVVMFFSLSVQWLFKRLNPVIMYWLFSAYSLLLFIVLFTKAPMYREVMIEPFQLTEWNRSKLAELILNLVCFIPLGTFFAIGTNFWQFIITATGVIVGIESLQYLFFLGTFSTQDIILNLVGCVIGSMLLPLIKRHFNTHTML